MKHSYNLIDKKWIPCLRENAGTDYLGLRDVLTNAPQIVEILGESPPITVAIHRLLLAILHRALDAPKDANDWQRIWKNESFDTAIIKDYFDEHYAAFDLFDEKYPFYQTAAVDYEYCVSIASLFFQNTKTAEHFGDKRSQDEMFVEPNEAARLLVTFQSFDFGGTKSNEKGKGKERYSVPAFLFQAAVGLVRGKNLFEILMLNFHRYNGEYSRPFKFDTAKDLPAWELKESTQPITRLPNGYADWLTWQSRRLRLKPELTEQGKVGVRQTIVMRGNELPKTYELKDREVMTAFVKRENPKEGEKVWAFLSFDENKALWRDSLSLIQSIAEKQERPKIFSWLNELIEKNILSRKAILPLDFYGLKAGDKPGKLKFWRHERIVLPVEFLDDEKGNKLRRELGKSLKFAEDVSKNLIAAKKRFATHLLATQIETGDWREEEKQISKLSKNTEDAINKLARTFNPEAFYWSRLETPFKALMLALPDDIREEIDEGETQTFYGEKELPRWREILRRTATDALLNTTRSLDASARNLKAAARAERLLYALLRETLSENKLEETR